MNSSREHILTRLSLSKSPVSGDVLASELGLSRAGIWKHIEALRNSGTDIQAQSGLGYVLNSEVFSAGALKARLDCKRIGQQIRIVEETGSTNHDIMQEAEQGRKGWDVVCSSLATSL